MLTFAFAFPKPDRTFALAGIHFAAGDCGARRLCISSETSSRTPMRTKNAPMNEPMNQPSHEPTYQSVKPSTKYQFVSKCAKARYARHKWLKCGELRRKPLYQLFSPGY